MSTSLPSSFVRQILVRALFVGVAATAPTLSAANTLSKADFYTALTQAMSSRQLRNQTTAGETLTLEELQGVGSHGAWRVFITNACLQPGADNRFSNNYGKLMRIRLPSVVANQGTRLQFVINSQAVQPHQRAQVEKALEERLATLNREYGDLKATINRLAEGTYQLAAEQQYGTSPSAGGTVDRLAATLSNARFMICDIYTAMELADAEQWRSLKSSKLTQLDRGQFIALYPLLKESGYEVAGNLPGGQWGFKLSSDLTTRVENHIEELRVWVYAKPATAPSPEKLTALKTALRALPLPLGATSAEVADPNERGFIWVGLVFPYKNMTGDEFTDKLKKLIDKRQVLDFHQRVFKVMRDAG